MVQPADRPPLLAVTNLVAGYGDLQVLNGISMLVQPGEVVALVGPNAAGKSTFLRSMSGLIAWQGQVSFGDRDLGKIASHEIVGLGLVHVPEGRMLFPFMTVEENLDVGAFGALARRQAKENKEKVFRLFPRLAERRRQLAGTLSGGEQQMCAIARGIMSGPRMLLLDEPSLGLAPKIVHSVYEKLLEVNAEGLTILLVEQNLKAALKLAQRGYVLEGGRIVLSGKSDDLLRDPRVGEAYLGR
jgi:branched-chain amino acid transport system ATP-binding protein